MDVIKQLRDKTGVSVMQCKKALEEAGGDLAQAEVILKERASASADKKADRELGAGAIGSYVHDGTVGAMILLACETDFVGKNPDFMALARDMAMQVSAMDPQSAEELAEQPFIKEGSKTVRDILNEATQKFGERVEVTQFSRFSAR